MGQLQNYTVDQLAGAIALTLGALGSLLLVIWQSRCLCKCRVGLSDTCYIFDCSREPPPLEQNDEEAAGEETLVPKQKSANIVIPKNKNVSPQNLSMSDSDENSPRGSIPLMHRLEASWHQPCRRYYRQCCHGQHAVMVTWIIHKYHCIDC